MCSCGCPQRKTTKFYCPGSDSLNISATPFSTHVRQLWQQISDVQQQGLVAPRWCKNLAERCSREGTGNDVRKYMIRSRLSNVSDCYVKSHLAQVGINARPPFLSFQIQWTHPSFPWYNRLSALLLSPCVSVRLLVVSEYRSLTLLDTKLLRDYPYYECRSANT